MMEDYRKQAFRGWAKFLNPEILKSNLIAASIFLAVYETLAASIIDRIRNFYSLGFDDTDTIINEKYKAEVLSLDKSVLRASLLWLEENSAINKTDITRIDQIRQHRNDLAHELPKFLSSADDNINVNLFAEIYTVLTKIDRWWIREVDLPTNEDYDGIVVADEEIISGNMIFVQLMIQIATGNDSATYWEEFQKEADCAFI